MNDNLTTSLFKQHKITAVLTQYFKCKNWYLLSSLVILKLQMDLINNITAICWKLRNSHVISFQTMKKYKCTLKQCTTVHFKSSYLWDMNATYKKE